MSGNAGAAEVAMVFEKLLTDYLARCDADLASLARRRMEMLSADAGQDLELRVGEDGKVSISPGGIDTDTAVRELAMIFDSIVTLAAMVNGREPAYRGAAEVLALSRKQFQAQFEALELEGHLLGGMLAGTASSGVDGLDRVLGGGIPGGSMVLVLGPPGSAKYQLAHQFLAYGLLHGGGGIAVTSTAGVDDLRRSLFTLGVSSTRLESQGLLKIIDWYTQRSRAIVGMEEHASVFVPSGDIANLDIAFMRALQSLAYSPGTRAAVDMVSPALGRYDLPDVVDFLQRQKGRLKEAGVTSIFVVEAEAHDDRVISTLKHMADGVLMLHQEAGALSLEVESMAGQRFLRGRFPVQASRRGLTVSGETLDLEGVISEFCNIPTVTREIAQRLIDAGFTDIEKLNSATEAELRTVSMVTDDVLRNIRDYTRTLEYSRSVLASRSDRWLRKAREQAAAGELERARKSIERALEIDQGNALAWLELSRINRMLGDDERSREQYRRAVAMDPGIDAGENAGGDTNGQE